MVDDEQVRRVTELRTAALGEILRGQLIPRFHELSAACKERAFRIAQSLTQHLEDARGQMLEDETVLSRWRDGTLFSGAYAPRLPYAFEVEQVREAMTRYMAQRTQILETKLGRLEEIMVKTEEEVAPARALVESLAAHPRAVTVEDVDAVTAGCTDLKGFMDLTTFLFPDELVDTHRSLGHGSFFVTAYLKPVFQAMPAFPRIKNGALADPRTTPPPQYLLSGGSGAGAGARPRRS